MQVRARGCGSGLPRGFLTSCTSVVAPNNISRTCSSLHGRMERTQLLSTRGMAKPPFIIQIIKPFSNMLLDLPIGTPASIEASSCPACSGQQICRSSLWINDHHGGCGLIDPRDNPWRDDCTMQKRAYVRSMCRLHCCFRRLF